MRDNRKDKWYYFVRLAAIIVIIGQVMNCIINIHNLAIMNKE